MFGQRYLNHKRPSDFTLSVAAMIRDADAATSGKMPRA